ncbi:MAG: hypothetical protein IJM79_07795 [Erysipelotrichaceae bacterium]|nr:hypothetical protein [Erysipelotrichaceae bacterium]
MENRTSIVFYSGLDSIGGVVMEVRYGNSRAFFEAGTAYNPGFDMFDGRVALRRNFISDYLWVNEIPRIDGIYRKQDIEKYPDLIPAEDWHQGPQAFFITHLHLDHMRMMGMISPLVTVYLSAPAQKIEAALEEVGQGVETIRGSSYSDMSDVTRVGDITVRRFILNDDSYQDYSFYIETPDLKIHHTGDLFVYGKYGDNVLKEAEFLRKENIDILVCEGTRFFPGDEEGEIRPAFWPAEGLISRQRCDEITAQRVGDFRGLVVFNYYEREMSDVMAFEKYAQQSGRELVYEPESAHIINRFFGKKVKIMLPDRGDRPDYYDEILAYNEVITRDQVLARPERYLVQNSYPNLLELLDYRHTPAMYLHYSGTPLGEFDPRYFNMKNIVELAGMQYVRAYQTDEGYFSPHAEKCQILAYIDMVNAKLVVPAHSSGRRAMIAHLKRPYYYASLRERYVYDRENNTLEVTENV